MGRRLALLAAVAFACAFLSPGTARGYTPLPPSLQVYFDPVSVGAGQTTTLNYHLTNPTSNTVVLYNVSFSNTLPAGLKVLSATRTVCGTGHLTLTKPTGVDLTGLTLAVGGSCDIPVTVYTLYPGEQSDPFEGATADLAGRGFGGVTSPALSVWAPPVVTLQFNPATVVAGNASTLDVLLRNPDTGHYFYGNLNLDVALPAGVEPGPIPTAACGSASVAVTGTTIHFQGMGLPTNSGCGIAIPVRGVAPGAHTTTATGDVDGWMYSGNVTTATLTVSPTPAPRATHTATAPPAATASSETPSAKASDSSPAPSVEATASSGEESSAPTASSTPGSGSTTTNPTSGDPPILVLVGGAAAVAVAGLVALGVFLRRRRKDA